MLRRTFRTKWLVLAGAALAVLGCWEAQAAEPLRVGVAGSAPFVVRGEEGLTGASVEIWRAVAQELGIQFTLVPFETIDELVAATATGSVALGVGPVSITSARAGRVDFTQPYFEAQLGLLAPQSSGGAFNSVRPFLSRAFLVAAGSLLLILFGVGNLLWFVERKRNPGHFPAQYRVGVLEGMWFAIVTMTTVGYGDRVPVSPAGRFVTGVWMIFSMIAASSITAGIATALTLSGLESTDLELKDLSGKRVAVVIGTTGTRIAGRYGARVSELANRDAAIAAVEGGKADAMLFDAPALQDWLSNHPDSKLVLARLPIAAVDYGFTVTPESPLRRPIDRTLLMLWERQRIQAELSAWLPAP